MFNNWNIISLPYQNGLLAFFQFLFDLINFRIVVELLFVQELFMEFSTWFDLAIAALKTDSRLNNFITNLHLDLTDHDKFKVI